MSTAIFGNILFANEPFALLTAQAHADQTDTPCGVWHRDGWYTVCEVAPELLEPDPEWSGWTLWAVRSPQ